MIKDLFLYNSLTQKKEKFEPISPPKVGMYTCGPTVYDYTHIGHLRKYFGDDLLKRVLLLSGYSVKHVMNITDVGHLTSDADEGEDKLEKGALKQGKTVWEVAKFFESQFFDSTIALGITRPDVVCRATEHVEDQIELIKKLEQKGFAYKAEEAVYFDVSKFENYTQLSRQKLEEKIMGAREEVSVDHKKRNPGDFALWLFTKGKFANHTMKWESQWGEGFPGWHIECSAMSMKYLGESFDIHTGGIDHIPVHHTNEIAQSEAATGKQFVKYWIHHNFLKVDGQKMSKSIGNTFTINDLKGKGFDPLSLRYLFLTAHYRDQLNFTWESLTNAQNALNNLRNAVIRMTESREQERTKLSEEKLEKIDIFNERFRNALNDDLNTPQAIAVLWEMLKSNIPTTDKVDMVYSFDEVFALDLRNALSYKSKEVPEDVRVLMEQREAFRQTGNFEKADEIRKIIESKGYLVEDTKLHA